MNTTAAQYREIAVQLANALVTATSEAEKLELAKAIMDYEAKAVAAEVDA